MKNDLPVGYWIKNKDNKFYNIGFQYGGHMGGECEIYLPIENIDKFCTDNNWRQRIVDKYYRIVYLATPDLKVEIPEEEKIKSGIVPLDWRL